MNDRIGLHPVVRLPLQLATEFCEKGFRMFAALRRDFRFAPVTFSLLAASVALFVAVELARGRIDDPKGVNHVFGMVVTLGFSKDDEVTGPFALWDGPWWRWLRIPASAFHHGHWLHLFFNVSSLWLLGPLLERRMRRTAYLGFWFFASLVPFLPEYFLGTTPLGLSGVACAMFGWCLIERQFDPVIERRLPEQAIRMSWFFLFLMMVLTALDVLHIANVAHFTGVAYGWLNARAAHHRTGRRVWIAGHALLPLVIYFLLHPFWNASYHALLGRRAEDSSIAEFHLREALRLNPAMPHAWLGLIEERTQSRDWLAAWRLVLEGLNHNRSSEVLTEKARRVWKRLPADEREEARALLQKTFGDTSQEWSERLRMTDPPLVDFESLLRGRKPLANPVDPDQVDSAAEGRTL
jgi:membrane associated rhomboid family serine protease